MLEKLCNTRRNTMQQTFELDGEYITLCNLLKVCGITDTGGIAKLMIADGWIKVDGQVELRKACKIRAGQIISGDDFAIAVISSPLPATQS